MKNFDAWNALKKTHDTRDRAHVPVYCKEREIWWISLGLNIGDEEDGKGDGFERPVLVIKKFNNNIFWGCALSTKIKADNRYYATINTSGGVRSVILSQLRLYDTKRLRERLETIGQHDFRHIKTALKALL
jgi:mRNA interferase MazF